MEGVKNKLYLYSSACGLITVAFILKVLSKTGLDNYLSMDIIFLGMILLMLLALSIRQFKLYKIANLILDNEILYVDIVETANIQLKACVSCFGILIGSKVIKYNMGGVDLKEINIDDKYLNISVAKGKKTENIKVLYGNMNKEELHRFIYKFNFETGIMPKLKHSV